MKKFVIIEDETIACERLRRLIVEVVPDAHIAATLQSIEESVEYFKAGRCPDIVFMDIHLADGSAFRIFDKTDINCPIVFTTAYDQYALDAFKVNSVDYLLKPVAKEDLIRALDKVDRLNSFSSPSEKTPYNLQHLASFFSEHTTYARNFLIPSNNRLIPINSSDIACICIDNGITIIILMNGHKHAVDYPLDTMMNRLDPSHFFRANRQYIVGLAAIREIFLWPIGKLALTLNVETPERIIISKNKVPEFKKWYTW